MVEAKITRNGSYPLTQQNPVDTLLANNGYLSAANVKACADRQIEPLIALGREAHHVPLNERYRPDAPAPETEDPLVKMAWRLKTKEGRKRYVRRKGTVEPVFGIIKQVMGFRQSNSRCAAFKPWPANGSWSRWPSTWRECMFSLTRDGGSTN